MEAPKHDSKYERTALLMSNGYRVVSCRVVNPLFSLFARDDQTTSSREAYVNIQSCPSVATQMESMYDLSAIHRFCR